MQPRDAHPVYDVRYDSGCAVCSRIAAAWKDADAAGALELRPFDSSGGAEGRARAPLAAIGADGRVWKGIDAARRIEELLRRSGLERCPAHSPTVEENLPRTWD